MILTFFHKRVAFRSFHSDCQNTTEGIPLKHPLPAQIPTFYNKYEQNSFFLSLQVQRAHHLAENAIVLLNKVDVSKLDKNSVHNLIWFLEEVMANIQQSKEQLAMTTSLSSTFPATPQNYSISAVKQLQQVMPLVKNAKRKKNIEFSSCITG